MMILKRRTTMSRIRTIKPEFFLDDELAELPPLTRLLFIGLWTLADCEGRLEDRPKRIKAQILPFDEEDTDAMLQTLNNSDFIQRYTVAGKRYLTVRNFKKHQRITGKEAENTSTMPPPQESQGNNGETTGKQRGNNGEEQEHHPCSNGETVNVQEGKGRVREGNGYKEGKGREVHACARVDEPKPSLTNQTCDEETIQAIISTYHKVLPMCKPVEHITPRLRAQLAARMVEDLPHLEIWQSFFQDIATLSPLLTGQLPPSEGFQKSFVASLEWITKTENYQSFEAGKYYDQQPPQPNQDTRNQHVHH
jgi:hypothetical protein